MKANSREVYRLHNDGWTQQRIAAHFGISQPRVSQLISAERTALALDAKDWETILADARQAQGRRRGERIGHLIVPGNPNAELPAKAPRPSLTGRQQQLFAMFNLALPEIDDDTAIRIGQELISLMRNRDEESPYAGLLPTERARERRRMANRLQGQPLVELTATTHEPMIGTHEHMVNGRIQEHSHYGDNTHEEPL